MIRNAIMELPTPQSRPPHRLHPHPARFLAALGLVAILVGGADALLTHRFSAIAMSGLFLCLLLVLIAAWSVGRGLLTPSLKELAFYFLAILAAGAIWPGAQLAISTYKDEGFLALAAFMIFVFMLAVALAVLSAYWLADSDDPT
jgi:hypothetical protein